MIPNVPLISFIIAAYNEERFIADCIDSCLAQTYPNIEVCITDDGSTDGTWDILVKNYGNHSNVKLDKFKKNRGKVFAINNSYKNSQGAYIALMGADDVCFENRIENSYHFLRENNCDLVFGKLFYCDEKLSPVNYGQRKIRKNIVTLERVIIDNIIGPTYFIHRNMA